MTNDVDVLVVGGGAAGLNAALMLARARRSVLVVDAGQPRNAPAAGVHGLLGHEGIAPGELLACGRAEVERYGGRIMPGRVESVTGELGRFTTTMADGTVVRARRLLVTTGLVDELPDVAGLRERWGHDVLHCPYCHGWEVQDSAIGVLATGPMSMHQALLFRQWTDRLTFITAAAPTAEEAEQLTARGTRVVVGEAEALEVVDDRLVGLRLRDGSRIALDALVVASRMVARLDFLAPLGLLPTAHPAGVGEHLPADPTGRTAVPGVWAAGNVTDLTAQVGASAAAGAMAGAQINADLVMEETSAAVAARLAS